MKTQIAFLLTLSLLLAQGESLPVRRPVLKFMPLAIMDPFQSTLHAGVEFPIGLENTIQAEGGWVFGSWGADPTDDFEQQGFKLRLSWREWFEPKARKTGSLIAEGGYLSLTGGYQHYRQSLQVDTSGGYGYFREYERTIQAFEVAVLLGYQTQVGRRLSIDFWGGLGARYTTHRWSPTKPQYGLLAFGRVTPVGDLILRPGGRPVPRLGISVGWILR